MGNFMGFMGKGLPLPTTQVLSFVTGTLYRQFIKKEINNFEDFHMAILDIFNTVNAALPSKHYDVPTPNEVMVCFKEWKEAEASKRKELFIKFMIKSVNLSKLDNSILITGLVTPPAAMAAKRAGETVPQLRLIKAIPDVVFVPTATVLALISAKLSKRIILRTVAENE